MARQQVIRKRTVKNETFVTLREHRFYYNAHFMRVAEFKRFKFVSYQTDDALREISFEFRSEGSDDIVYKLENRDKAGKSRSYAADWITDKSWVKSVMQQENPKLRMFRAEKDGRLWCIRLTPSFEHKVDRDDVSEIPAGASGIYRYISIDSEIVYIGKGLIQNRFRDPERQAWSFTRIEYSLVPDQEQHYKSNHAGRLPYYNRQDGHHHT
jgi:hypothetical protein